MPTDAPTWAESTEIEQSAPRWEDSSAIPTWEDSEPDISPSVRAVIPFPNQPMERATPPPTLLETITPKPTVPKPVQEPKEVLEGTLRDYQQLKARYGIALELSPDPQKRQRLTQEFTRDASRLGVGVLQDKAVSELLLDPTIEFPGVSKEDMAILFPGSKVAQVAGAAQRVIAGAATGLTAPIVAAVPVLPPAGQKIVSGAFAAQMGSHVPELARAAGEASVSGDLADKVETTGNLIATSAFAVGAGTHALSGKGVPAENPLVQIPGEKPGVVPEITARAELAGLPATAEALKNLPSGRDLTAVQLEARPIAGTPGPEQLDRIQNLEVKLYDVLAKSGELDVGPPEFYDWVSSKAGRKLTPDEYERALNIAVASKTLTGQPEAAAAVAPEASSKGGISNAKEEGRTQEGVLEPQGPPVVPPKADALEASTVEESDFAGVPVKQIPSAEIATRPDLMQFKRMDDTSSGVNEADKLSGQFDTLKAGNLLLWEPIDPGAHGLSPGQKYIVANGHHRFDFGKEQGVEAFNAQIIREADGYSAPDASALGAEINIADGKGSIYDQAKFIRNEAATHGKDAALERARSVGARGRKAATIGIEASDSLFDSFINEQITPEQAEVIAKTAPRDEALQQAGIQLATKGIEGAELSNTLHAIKANRGASTGVQSDLFGNDDSALNQARDMAREASRRQKEISEQIAAVQGAAKRPEQAAKLGVNVSSPEEILRTIDALKAERARWENWALHPDLVAQVRGGTLTAPVAEVELKKPKLAAGENQGDLISSTQSEDFALVGEKGIDLERVQREKDKAAQDAAEAKAKTDREQGGLFEQATRPLNELLEEASKPKIGIVPGARGGSGLPSLRVPEEMLQSSSRDVEARWQAAHGIGDRSFLQRIKTGAVELKNAFTRHFPKLDPKTDGREIDILRHFEATPLWAKEMAGQMMRGFTTGFKREHLNLFERVVILRDLARDIAAGEYAGKELPFGYVDEAAVRADLSQFERIAQENPGVSDALTRRKEFMDSLRERMIQSKLLPESVRERDDYFHRQVLQFMRLKDEASAGTGSKDVRTHRKGFQRERRFSSKDYNTSYLEAEYEVLAQSFAQLNTVETLTKLKASSDIRPSLNSIAKETNLENVHGGADIYRRVQELRAEIRELQNSPDRAESYVRQQLRALHEQLDPIDVLAPFRMAKVRAKAVMGKLAATGALENVPEQFRADVRKLAAEYEANRRRRRGEDEDEVFESLDFDAEEQTDFMGFVSWLSKQAGEEARPALSFFKAIQDQIKFIDEKLGDTKVEWKDFVPKDHTAWQPKRGNLLYRAQTLSDRIIEKILEGEKLLEETDLKEVMAVGGKRSEWVIPKRLAETLDDYRARKDDNVIEKASAAALYAWKKFTLFSPTRVLKYELNNFSGDLDIALAWRPELLKNVKQAAADSRDYRIKTKAPSAEQLDLIRKGVLGSGFFTEEVGGIRHNQLFDALQKPNADLIGKYFGTVEKYNAWREDVLRLAAYRYSLERLNAGEQVYGASDKAQVDAIPDLTDKAAKISRELIGDYGNVSRAGQWIRRHLIPFYSWMEINAPRYVRLARNIKNEDTGLSGATRLTTAAAGKAAIAGTKFAAKAAGIYALVNLWNQTFFPEEDKELNRDRNQQHLILGRDENGNIRSIRFQGAFSDALSWFGAEDYPEDLADVASGNKSVTQLFAEAGLAPVNKLVNASAPGIKTALEASLGLSAFPELFEVRQGKDGIEVKTSPRPIRDSGEHVARLFSVDMLYRWIAKIPTPGVRADMAKLVSYSSNPGESAYYAAREIVADFNLKQGKETGSTLPTKKDNALFYHKQALKYGDAKLADHWKARYLELGGNAKGIANSIERANPLGGLTKKDRSKFYADLSPEEASIIAKASEWYRQTYLKPRE